jgi:hypothetical protein
MSTKPALTASLFTRDARGLQSWPDDGTTIEIPARCRVQTFTHTITKDSAIEANNVVLFIPRGGSVVIEAADNA